ncbi:MAG: S8 family serine peptidase [FCB group bacterium]|nr:S8 family serine peptidase [FCB group bacterium]
MKLQGRLTTVAICTAGLIFMLAGLTTAADNITDRLEKRLIEISDTTTVKVWLFFTDKDNSPEIFQKAAVSLSSRAAHRRKDIPLDWYDLPVNPAYVNTVRAAGGTDIHTSRWLNAVSARLTRSQIETLADENFIKKIDPVAVGIRREPQPTAVYEKPVVDSADYGISYIQNHMLGVDSLHRTYIPSSIPGDSVLLDGNGVLLAFFDTGFNTSHIAFNSMSIIDTYDFINDDSDVTDDVPSPEQTSHGTSVLSVCGAYDPGDLIGPAYGADYALYKTERTDSEIVIEEDYWVLAAERADSIGADIISASLGYFDWYTYEDMNGDSAITTMAADLAASRGILVVTAAGNEGDDPWHYIIAPADGDSVVAVGAINANGAIAAFSSFGPTYDGRIKPDVLAIGVGTRGARTAGGYGPNWGTSVATPLIAGSAALLLQANPSLSGNPMGIKDRLIMAADLYLDPDFQYGYGQPDMILASGFAIKIYPIPNQVATVGSPGNPVPLSAVGPVGEEIIFTSLDLPANFNLTSTGLTTAELTFIGSADQTGAREYRIEASAGDLADTMAFIVVTAAADAAMPFLVGPNPFHDSIAFFPTRPYPDGYTIEVFTVAGELMYQDHSPENAIVVWHGVNQDREKAAAGVYIIRFSADGIDEKVKVLKR